MSSLGMLLPLDEVLRRAEAAAILAEKLAIIADDDSALTTSAYTVGVMAASQSAAASHAAQAWSAYATVRIAMGETIQDPDDGDPRARLARRAAAAEGR